MLKNLCLLSLIALLGGCQASHLVYVQDTSFGLVLDVGGETGNQKISAGFDRDTVAIVPRKAKGEDAMAIASTARIAAIGLEDVVFDSFVATGAAASAVALDANLFERIDAEVQKDDKPE